MKLYLNDTSPFSRAVVTIGVLSKCDTMIMEWTDPWVSPTKLTSVNPLCQIPSLLIDDTTALSESLCICQYLINKFKPSLIRDINISDQIEVAMLGFAKSLMEVAFRTVMISRFTSIENNKLIERGHDSLVRALEQLDNKLDCDQHSSYTAPHLANLYLHIALDYIKLRHDNIFNSHESFNIKQFQINSPFNDILNKISLDCLGSKPISIEHLMLNLSSK